eukprot:GILJ01002201.1.p1 GENE.GILJ01002201.1~~GILJ01002201.1.p1  ORF type:complete len:823 (+),score=83.57 GILJ01002201.1:47-2470(+)
MRPRTIHTVLTILVFGALSYQVSASSPAAWCHNDQACGGAAVGTCNVGFTGTLCELCVDGYHLQSYCSACPDSYLIYATDAVGIVLIVGAIYVITRGLLDPDRRLLVSMSTNALLLLSFVQTVSLLTSLQVQWPDPLELWFTYFSFANIDYQYVRSECLSSFSLSAQRAIKYLTPIGLLLIFIALKFILGAIVQLWSSRSARKYAMVTAEAKEGNLSSRPTTAWTTETKKQSDDPILQARLLTEQPVKPLKSMDILHFSFVMMEIMLIGITRSVAETFQCTETSSRLIVNPSYECFSSEWIFDYLLYALAAGVVYLVGSLVFAFWFYKSAPTRVSSKQFREAFKMVWVPLRRDKWWWLGVNVARKIAITLTLAIATDNSFFRLLICLVIALCFLLAQVRCLPYYDMVSNRLEILLQTCQVILIAIATLIVNPVFLPTQSGEDIDKLRICIYVLVFGGGGIAFCCIVSEYFRHRSLTQSRKRHHEEDDEEVTPSDVFLSTHGNKLSEAFLTACGLMSEDGNLHQRIAHWVSRMPAPERSHLASVTDSLYTEYSGRTLVGRRVIDFDSLQKSWAVLDMNGTDENDGSEKQGEDKHARLPAVDEADNENVSSSSDTSSHDGGNREDEEEREHGVEDDEYMLSARSAPDRDYESDGYPMMTREVALDPYSSHRSSHRDSIRESARESARGSLRESSVREKPAFQINVIKVEDDLYDVEQDELIQSEMDRDIELAPVCIPTPSTVSLSRSFSRPPSSLSIPGLVNRSGESIQLSLNPQPMPRASHRESTESRSTERSSSSTYRIFTQTDDAV